MCTIPPRQGFGFMCRGFAQASRPDEVRLDARALATPL